MVRKEISSVSQLPEGMNDIIKDPHKYGVPTIEEFMRNPAKYQTTFSDREELDMVDNGGQNLRRILVKKTYHVGTQEFKSLEKAQQFCIDHGIPMGKWKAHVEKVPGNWAHEKVIFMSPEEFERRSNW